MNPSLTPPLLAPLLVLADHGHLRIYRVLPSPNRATAHLETALSADFPHGRENYWNDDSDKAGRFPSNGGRGGQMSIDERLPMQREHEQRVARDIASQVEAHLALTPDLAWYISAPPALEHAILNLMSQQARTRLIASIGKNLVGQKVNEIVAHLPSPGK